ncbi:MAG TPA: hypothetical protein VMU16_01280, partial [Candidatus Binataceae bacterium]|nr:hypothetical protein [Candidatus Binataceae bacterium]
FSAIKRSGVPLYKLARRGEVVEPPAPRQVEIKRLALSMDEPGAIRFTAECSPGTYARSLARDIGIALGTVAHLEELRRTRNGRFSLADAHPLDAILAAADSDPSAIALIGLREAVADLPEIKVDRDSEKRLRNGDSRALNSIAPNGAGLFKLVSPAGQLIAIARATSRVTAAIERIFNPPCAD